MWRPPPNLDRVYAESRVREPGFVMPEHHCHHFWELFHVERGSCRFMIENNMVDLHAGDLIFIPPERLHYTRYLGGGPCKRNDVFFREEDVEAGVKALMPGGEAFFTATHVLQTPASYWEELNGLVARMVREERIADNRSPLLLRYLLQELVLLCGRVCHVLREAPTEFHTTDWSVICAARYIAEHYMLPITSAEIAAASGLSQNYLSRKFREAAGIGLREYLIFIRLQHAALELISTTASVTDIALRCGFSDGNYFKDVFKQKYGLTPRAYRREKEQLRG